MANTLGATNPGQARLTNVPDEQRLYDRDKKLVRITHGRKIFSQIMMENFKSNTITATDPTPKWKSDVEKDILFQMSTNSGAIDGGTENKIFVLDAIAARIQPNDQILCEGVFYNGTAFTTTRSATNPQRELLFVVQKGTSDGTSTWFKVTRGYGAYTGTASNLNTAPELTNTMYFTLLPMTVPQGTDESTSYTDNPSEETNYCQIFLQKWGIDETTQNTRILQDESIMSRNGRRALEEFFKKLENAFQHGRKGTGVKNGRTWWTTGGFEEYVYTANTQLGYAALQNVEDFTTTYGAMSPQNFNSFLENKFYYGNPEMKVLVLGASAYTKYCNAFDPKVRIVNQKLSDTYGITITDHVGSNGGVMHITKSDDMSLNRRTNEGYIVDFAHFQYMHMDKMDLHIIEDVETEPHETVNEIYGQLGVHRTNPFAHWVIWNF